MIEVLSRFSQCVERASIDEAYVDLTDEVNNRLSEYAELTEEQLKNTFVVGWEDEDSEDELNSGDSSRLHVIDL